MNYKNQKVDNELLRHQIRVAQENAALPEHLHPIDEFPVQFDHPDLDYGEAPAVKSQNRWLYPLMRMSSSFLFPPGNSTSTC